MKRLLRRRRLVMVALALLLLLAADYYGYERWTRPGGESHNAGTNGLWLRYHWYFGRKGEDDVRRLGARLLEDQIRYAYFHVRMVGNDGRLQHRHPGSAHRLLAVLREEAPSVKALAWVYAGNRGAGGVTIRLADPSVRRAMVEEAVWLVTECGFDGIQWDYEVCRDGDAGFLALLRETRSALSAGALLSVATPVWSPVPRLNGWSEDYFGEVAENCDQIAVMCYDTGVFWPRGYVWLVRGQAARVTRAVAGANPECQVLLGLPTYHKGLRSHNPRAENLRLALKGVREGMSDSRAGASAFAGIALFADWTTQPEEWELYRRHWLGQ
jgi:hypothetical protein